MSDTPTEFRMPVRWEDLPRFGVREHVERCGFRGENVLMVMNYLSPGMTLKPHSHPFEQIACVLQGRMRWQVGGKEFEMGAGEVLRIPPDVVHGGCPVGDEVVLNLDIFCPIREDYAELVDHQADEFR